MNLALAAVSSSASSRPASRQQIAATAPALSSVIAKSGDTALARRRKSRPEGASRKSLSEGFRVEEGSARVPRSISVLGFIGYAALLIGSSLELFGLDLYLMHYVPGGLFELILPMWLIFKGFDSAAIAFEPANPDDGGWIGVRQPAVASQQGAGNGLR
jgi:hypothetical protein